MTMRRKRNEAPKERWQASAAGDGASQKGIRPSGFVYKSDALGDSYTMVWAVPALAQMFVKQGASRMKRRVSFGQGANKKDRPGAAGRSVHAAWHAVFTKNLSGGLQTLLQGFVKRESFGCGDVQPPHRSR